VSPPARQVPAFRAWFLGGEVKFPAMCSHRVNLTRMKSGSFARAYQDLHAGMRLNATGARVSDVGRWDELLDVSLTRSGAVRSVAKAGASASGLPIERR